MLFSESEMIPLELVKSFIFFIIFESLPGPPGLLSWAPTRELSLDAKYKDYGDGMDMNCNLCGIQCALEVQ